MSWFKTHSICTDLFSSLSKIYIQVYLHFLGYLLDPNGEKCATTPRQVSALHHKEVGIAMAAASDGATVVVTQRGDVYLLADYQCKKMASKLVKSNMSSPSLF